MWWLPLLFFVWLSAACHQPDKPLLQAAAPIALPVPALRAYADFTSTHRRLLHDVSLPMAQRMAILFTAIDSMQPYWRGTRWDYNGTSRQPGQGSIACGYFVCHVLADLGFRIPIRQYATRPSSFMVRRLCQNIRSGAMGPAFETYLQNAALQSVHLIGLDFHTGLLLKDQRGQCWLLHSFYQYRVGVIKEPATTSAALRMSRSFMIGQLRLPR